VPSTNTEKTSFLGAPIASMRSATELPSGNSTAASFPELDSGRYERIAPKQTTDTTIRQAYERLRLSNSGERRLPRIVWVKGGGMKTVSSEIEIAAPAATVWDVLTNMERYPEWNPFITEMNGTLQVGQRLKVRIQPPGGRAMTFRPTVRSFVPERELAWLGHLVIPRLFDGEHRFSIQPLEEDRIRFRQEEAFRGLLVPLTQSMLARTARGFEAMNGALKERAESASPKPPR
jgi:hypothetical protein